MFDNLEEFNSYIYKNKKDIINQYYSILVEEAENIKKNVSNNKDWLENQPVMQDFLNKLQFLLQEKNISFFSSLITALASDVINPLDENIDKEVANDIANIFNKEINFDLYVKGGMPALKINAKTQDNNIEKITSGGLKNVIATGLRVLALWRLTHNIEKNTHNGEFSHRRFLFMDEPDCWIGKASIPNYAKLLYQLSKHFNLQILMVTHNDVNYFTPYARVYKIEKGDFANLTLLSDVKLEDDNLNLKNDEYIKSFQLINFKTYKDVKIELSPGLTVIVGKSDSGKSVIMEAFNALINNHSDDDVIRHFENKSIINFEIDNNYYISWERVRKTNTENPQKVRYKLYQKKNGDLNLLNDEFNSFETPDFIQKVLKMKKIDGIDIHLGVQEDMTFLFNPRISDYDRAKILSLGKESAYINAMMEDLRTKTRDIKSLVKIEEKKYNKLIFNILNILEVDKDDNNYNFLFKLEKQLKDANKLIENLKEQESFLNSLKTLNSLENIIFKKNQNEIIFFNTQDLDNFLNYETYFNSLKELDAFNLNRFNLDKPISHIDVINDLIKKEFFNIQFIKLNDDNREIFNIEIFNKILNVENYFNILKNIGFIDICLKEYNTFSNLSNIDEMGVYIKKINETIEDNKEKLFEINKNIEEYEKLICSLEKEMNTCPLCGNKFH